MKFNAGDRVRYTASETEAKRIGVPTEYVNQKGTVRKAGIQEDEVYVKFDNRPEGSYTYWVYEDDLVKLHEVPKEKELEVEVGDTVIVNNVVGVNGYSGSDRRNLPLRAVVTEVKDHGIRVDMPHYLLDRETANWFISDGDYTLLNGSLPTRLNSNLSTGGVNMTAVTEAIKAEQQRIAKILGEIVAEEAEDRDWCDEVDEVLEKLSEKLGFQVQRYKPRMKVLIEVESEHWDDIKDDYFGYGKYKTNIIHDVIEVGTPD